MKNCMKKNDFQWTPEAEKAFQDMKQCIAKLSIVTAPKPKENLIIYLCAARDAIIAVLLIERDSQQMPVYFVSRAFQDLKVNYSLMEKLVLGRLRRYFQAHPIAMITDQPIKQILSWPENTERILKRKFELEAFDITYRPRKSIRGQVLAEFIAERPEEDGSPANQEAEEATQNLSAKRKVNRRNKDPRGRKRGRTLMDDTTGRVPHRRHTTGRVPFPKAQRKVKFLIVVVDYFTKWIEAKPVATTTRNQIKKFVWDNIACRFGLPGEIISDNEKKFRDNPFKDCLGDRIKARLGEDNKNWVEELPHVLWAHRTEIKSSNGHTLFFLTYSTEAVIPMEIGMPSLKCKKIDQAMNDKALLLNLDILEEIQEKAAIQETRSKAKMEKYYNAKVRSIIFKPGDFVCRSNEASHAKEGGKLDPKWEGPYEVVEALGKGAYKIRNGSEDILSRI
nr:reverse transcriptase domain-containing protein [Tanacetum cinerariifolium]